MRSDFFRYPVQFIKAILCSAFIFCVIPARTNDKPNDTAAIHSLIREGVKAQSENEQKKISLFQHAILIAESNNYQDDMVVAAQVSVCDYLIYRGEVNSAIKYALKALKYYDVKGQKKKSIEMLGRIGDILRGNEVYDESYKYFTKALDLLSQVDDSSLYATIYNQIAATYFEDSQYPLDSSWNYAKKSLAISQKLRLQYNIYSNLNILAGIETKRSNYSQAVKYFEQALPIAMITAKGDEALILTNLANTYKSMNQNSKAEALNLKALELATKYNIPQYVKLSCQNLYLLYKSVGEYKKSLDYLEESHTIEQKIISQRIQVQVQDFNYMVELDKKEDENRSLEYQQTITKSNLNLTIIITMFLSVILLSSVAFIIYQQRQKKKKRQIISELDQSNKVLKRFISILAHDLRSPFNSILGFCDMLKNDPFLTEEERTMAINNLYSSSQSTFRLLERLLEWSKLEPGSVKPIKRQCDLNELVSEAISLVEHAARLKNILIEHSFDQSPQVFSDPNMISTALRNIISNAVKFTHPGGEIHISTHIANRSIMVVVQDSGIGMPANLLQKLFRLEENYSSKGTAGESGTGLGLILSKDYIEMNDGTIEVSSEPGKGSRFTIRLPLFS